MIKKTTILFLALVATFGGVMFFGQGRTFSVSHSRVVEKSPEQIWEVLTDVERWPDWWPGMEKATIDPGWQPGASLALDLRGQPKRGAGRLETADPGRAMSWTGKGVLGSQVRTTIRLQSGSAGTQISLENKISGPQAILAKITGDKAFSDYQGLVLQRLTEYLEQSTDQAR